MSDALHSFIMPAAGKAGGTGPALVDSAAASLGRRGHLFSPPEQGQPPRTSDMAPFIWCISLAWALEISGPSTHTILQE